MNVRLKRVYESCSEDDGFRVLVDRLWPRGLKKSELKLDYWAREIAPTTVLRKWFEHDPAKWEEFKKKYRNELDNKRENVREITKKCDKITITFLYSAKNRECNQAVVLKEYVEELLREKE